MKVLDVGCHDGYVGKWLRERYDGDLVLDGMELHPDACMKALERGYRRVVQGLAQDAPKFFNAGEYDAVVAYEVIEHVPDMDAFLEPLERMLKPGGRLYISTPDGTFGDGNNPHHLRALRAIDLADVLRRRGSLTDMDVGTDGITVASYTPRERLSDVAIFCGPGWSPWSPGDIATKGLGGSETAAVRLADELSEIGFIVTVYGETETSMFRDVMFKNWRAFDPTEPREAVISSRTPELFDRPVAAAKRFLWMHDTDCADRLTPARAESIDYVLTLSDWHRQHVRGLYPFLSSKLRRVRNGIHRPYFDQAPERATRLVYTSSPDRGLDILLELWPEVRKHVPDAEFCYAYAPVYWEIAKQDATVGAHAARIAELSEQDGVHNVGPLSQPEIAELMCSSLVWAAPSWNTPFDVAFQETSCIGAMEAQAAGCVVVASNWGALPETVQVGQLVDRVTEKRWRKAFVNAIVEGLKNEDTQKWAQTAGPRHAASLGWDGVAIEIGKLIAE